MARHGIDAIMFPKQQRRPLPSFLYKSFFCDASLVFVRIIYEISIPTITNPHVLVGEKLKHLQQPRLDGYIGITLAVNTTLAILSRHRNRDLRME